MHALAKGAARASGLICAALIGELVAISEVAVPRQAHFSCSAARFGKFHPDPFWPPTSVTDRIFPPRGFLCWGVRSSLAPRRVPRARAVVSSSGFSFSHLWSGVAQTLCRSKSAVLNMVNVHFL